MSNNCLVKKYKASVNNPNLPILETMQQFTLDAIAAGGNKSMTDAQKWALNHFFYQIGAIDNNGIWSKAGFVILPIIGANKNYHPYDYKNNVLLFKVINTMIDTNGGLEVYFESPNTTGVNLNSNIQNVDGSSIGCFVSSVNGKTINSTNAAALLRIIFTFEDATNITLSNPDLVASHIQTRYQNGIDYCKRIADDYANNYIRSVLLNVNGIPSKNTINMSFVDTQGNLLESTTFIDSGTYIDTSEKIISNRQIKIGSGNTIGVLMFFTEALTDAECSKLIQANQELIEAF